MATLAFTLVSSSESEVLNSYHPLDHFKQGFSELAQPPALLIAAVGASAAGLSILADDRVRTFFSKKNRLEGWRQLGNAYGDYPFQFGLGFFLLGSGLISSSTEVVNFAEADLEALSLASGATAVLKLSVPRDRPSGGSQSFPSGHSTRAFATAGSLFNLGHPLLSSLSLAMGSLTIAARLDSHKHYLSDTLAGATLGFVFGYAFSRHHETSDSAPSRWIVLPLLESRREFGLLAQLNY